jgi:hypothetical protein
MKRFFKQHIGLIILIVISLVFPTSLTNQAKLNMRIIVTGLAIDKVDDEYEVTAQFVKNTPGNESPGTSATIEFITEKAETIALALSNLSYKSGKVAAFSHTSFIIMGDSLLDDATKCLDYFIRDKIIKSSTMLVFAEGSAKDEIKKTKNVELSVGLGLQKVFLYKEKEGDGLMMTVLDFLKASNTYSKTALASTIKLEPCDESGESSSSGTEEKTGQSEGGSSSTDDGSTEGSGSGNQSSSSIKSGSQSSSNGGVGGGSSSGSNASSSGSQSSGSSSQSGSEFFKAQSPILCFVNGKYATKLETYEEFVGFMLANRKTTNCVIFVSDIEGEKFENAKISINIKSKASKFKIRYENGTPCLDISVFINNAEINEILSNEFVEDIKDDDYEKIESATNKEISRLLSASFEKAKTNGIDLFGAYELAQKFAYKETQTNFESADEFLSKLKLNVNVVINKLDF